MPSELLSSATQALLDSERRLLGEIAAALAADDGAASSRASLIGAIEQLDDLFLVVVVGEFNAGKSAFLNTLLGADALAEGVTPTTSRLALLRWGAEVGRVLLDEGRELVTLPADRLRETTFVDTPGTNALDRRHEALTQDFVPRADLVLFVTSADRPFSESERAFLESIRRLGQEGRGGSQQGRHPAIAGRGRRGRGLHPRPRPSAVGDRAAGAAGVGARRPRGG